MRSSASNRTKPSEMLSSASVSRVWACVALSRASDSSFALSSSERSSIARSLSKSAYAASTAATKGCSAAGTPSSAPRCFLSWRRSSLCICALWRSVLGESCYGHGLIVQAALATVPEGGKLAIRVEAGNLRIRPEDISDCLDFFFGALLHHKLTTDTAHQNGKIRPPVAQPIETGLGGGRRAIDQIV